MRPPCGENFTFEAFDCSRAASLAIHSWQKLSKLCAARAAGAAVSANALTVRIIIVTRNSVAVDRVIAASLLFPLELALRIRTDRQARLGIEFANRRSLAQLEHCSALAKGANPVMMRPSRI